METKAMDAVSVLDRSIAHVGEHGFTPSQYGARGRPCCYIGVTNVVCDRNASARDVHAPNASALMVLDDVARKHGVDPRGPVAYPGRLAEALSNRQAVEALHGGALHGGQWADHASELTKVALETLREARDIAEERRDGGGKQSMLDRLKRQPAPLTVDSYDAMFYVEPEVVDEPERELVPA